MDVWARIRRPSRIQLLQRLDTIFQLNRPDRRSVIGVVKKSCARFSNCPRNEAVLLVFMVVKQTHGAFFGLLRSEYHE